VISGNQDQLPELIFTSSGTTGTEVSRHYVQSPGLYEASFLKAFAHFYGLPSDYRIFALLPSYLERGGSSLVYMAERLIRESGHPESGFFLDDLKTLRALLQTPHNKKTLLIGVSYALLDLAEMGAMPLQDTTVMETGGMKGRRKEMTRAELHGHLAEGFGAVQIHSEYGMTELLSQAYAKKDGQFETPPWMKLLIRDVNDPLNLAIEGRTGGVNVVDLANLHSCSFIATSDLGRGLTNGKTEILGRFDYSDMRGCNLMVGF
jgi:phenylacetate-coenzyme A ligase PaaK-like adenylate-forming protein